MSDDAMLDEFKIEAAELFESAENSFLEIDKGEDFSSNFNSIFRAFHSLKGAAGMFGINDLQSHMHKLENLLESMKSQGHFDKVQIDYFLSGIDAAKSILEGGSPEFKHIELADFSRNKEVGKASRIEEAKVKQEQKHTEDKLGLVYIVDDEVEITNIIAEVLEDIDFAVQKFNSAKDLLAALNESVPDVVLSDINMPGMNGVEMIESINEINQDIPVIFISAYITKDVMLNALNYGAYAFIEKPFDEIRIANVVRNAVKKFKAVKLLNKSIDYILYQFSDLDEFLKSQGKENIRVTLKDELKKILDQKKLLKQLDRI